jgi:hypothetical protein
MKTKITFLIIALTATVVLTSCFNMFSCVKGSGDIVKEEREVSSFTKIELRTHGDVYFKQGDTHSLRIETDDNLLDFVKTEIDNDVLVIYTEKNICPEKLRLDLILQNIDGIEISGSGNIKCINDLQAKDLDIKISGSGDIRIPSLQANFIDIEVSGSGDIFMEGNATKILAEINGSGDVKCLGLKVKSAKIEINGSGDFAIEAEERLDVEIAGSGNIEYRGNPSIQKDILGSGDIIKK